MALRLVIALASLLLSDGYQTPMRGIPRRMVALQSGVSSRDKMLGRAIDLMDFKRTYEDNPPPLSEEPLYPAVEAAVLAADGRKAAYLHGMRISRQSEIATFMLIAEGNSRPQIQAIANAVVESLLIGHSMEAAKQGTAMSGWIVLDYGSLIIHVMTPQMRNFYKIEKRWKDAEVLDLTHLLVGDRKEREDEELLEEAPPAESIVDDPFWS